MRQSDQTGRRDFTKRTLLAAAALTAGDVAAKNCFATDQQGAQKSKTKIRIGTRINPEWMQSTDDNDLRFLKQIGVDAVDVTLHLVPGAAEQGVVHRQALVELISRLDGLGLPIERFNTIASHYLNAHLGRPSGQREIDNLKRTGELLAEFEIPVFGIQACQARLHATNSAGRWLRRQGRGGYGYLHFDQDRVTALGIKPRYPVTSEQLWNGLLNIYRQVVPIVDGSKTKIAMHGNDPPLYKFLGNPQILCRFTDFDRLFREVPSANTGITFCCGTRYESGEDVLRGIEHFGKQRKLFHVHFRNVRGTLPENRAYSEVFVDDGDMPMGQLVRALNAVGYDGVIDYDHPVGITGDQPLPKQYVAFAVGYMRGLIDNL